MMIPTLDPETSRSLYSALHLLRCNFRVDNLTQVLMTTPFNVDNQSSLVTEYVICNCIYILNFGCTTMKYQIT